MFDSVIVTLRTKDNSFTSVDLDIPCKEPLDSLKGKLLEILRSYDNQLFGKWQDIKFINEMTGRRLSLDKTLEDVGIWDGSIIIIEE